MINKRAEDKSQQPILSDEYETVHNFNANHIPLNESETGWEKFPLLKINIYRPGIDHKKRN